MHRGQNIGKISLPPIAAKQFTDTDIRDISVKGTEIERFLKSAIIISGRCSFELLEYVAFVKMYPTLEDSAADDCGKVL